MAEVRFLINTVSVNKFENIAVVVRLLIFVVIYFPIFMFLLLYISFYCVF